MARKKTMADEAASFAETAPGTMPEDSPVRDSVPQVCAASDKSGYIATRINPKTEQEVFTKISNFVFGDVHVARLVDQDDGSGVSRRVTLLSGKVVREFHVKPEALSTLPSFRTWLAKCGGYQFTGNEGEMHAVLGAVLNTAHSEEIRKNIIGYDADRKVWVFGNVVVADGQVYRGLPDGQIATPCGTFSMDVADAAEPILMRCLWAEPVSEPHRLLAEVMKRSAKLWGDHTEIAWGWALANLWRSRWILYRRSFPLISVCGPKGKGKTEFIRILMGLFSRDYRERVFNNLTETAYFNTVNRVSNLPVWVDEYRHDVSPALREALKGNYNGTERTVGTLDVHKTKSRHQRAAVLISGEASPKDQALDSRIIDIPVVLHKDTAMWTETLDMKDKLSAYTLWLLTQWEDLWALMQARYDAISRDWRKDESLDQRIVDNYIKVCATLDILFPDGTREPRFRQYCTKKVSDNQEVNPVARMLEMLPFYILNKRAVIPYAVNTRKGYFAVQASFLATIHFNEIREPLMPPKQIIQLGKDAGLLIDGHAGAAMGKELMVDRRDGTPATKSIQRCYVFRLDHPLVKRVVGELSAVDSGKDDPVLPGDEV